MKPGTSSLVLFAGKMVGELMAEEGRENSMHRFVNYVMVVVVVAMLLF